MTRKLDVERIKKMQDVRKEKNKRDIEYKRIKGSLDFNKNENSQLIIIEPRKKENLGRITKKLHVGAYVRVSTQEESQLNSFEMQIKHFTDLINENPNYEMVKIYSDEGISGTQVCKRKGFLEMIEDSKAGKLDLILTKSISRFGRNVAEVLSALQILEELNPPVAVVFETDHLDTSDGKNKMFISLMSTLSEMESQAKSEAVKSGIIYRMQNGIYKYSVNNTLGYYRDYSGMVRIEKNEAEIVRYIYSEFLDGVYPKDIGDSLTSIGLPSPKGLASWSSSSIRGILSNEKYCGDVLYQKTFTKSYITHLSKKNNGELRQWLWTNEHEPIISKDKWLRVQELLKTKKYSFKKHSTKVMKKQLIVSRIKSGPLSGFYMIDPRWNKEDRSKFIELIKYES